MNKGAANINNYIVCLNNIVHSGDLGKWSNPLC
jgi:hypothetical protein